MEGFKEVQKLELPLLRRVLNSGIVRKNTVAVDGGAHVGGWTAEMAPRFRHVYAFEPANVNYQRLTRNVARFENVLPLQFALLDAPRRVRMLCESKPHSTTSLYFEDAEDGVKALALDSLRLKNVGLIKLDLEGSEPLALIGMMKTIMQCRPVMIVEVSKLVARYGFLIDAVPRMLAEAGYRCVAISEPNRVFVPQELAHKWK